MRPEDNFELLGEMAVKLDTGMLSTLYNHIYQVRRNNLSIVGTVMLDIFS